MSSAYFLLSSLSSVMLCWGLVTSIQAPFFPIEALKKGASISEFSPIFGTVHLSLCLTSPFMGQWIRVIGVDRAFKIGVLLPSISCILFGCLTFISSKIVFLVLAYLLRLIEGVGGAIVFNATLTLLLARFPNSSSGVYSLVVATFGLGSISGPVFGSYIFKAGGFLLPFLVCGVALAVAGFLSVFAIKEVLILVKHEEDNKKLSMKELLFIPSFIAGLLSGSITGCSIFFIDSLLEPFLSQFHLKITKIGSSYLAMTVPYTCACLLIGWLNDRYSTPWMFSICGLIINLIGFILVGPSPYLPLSPSYTLSMVGLIFIGTGTGIAEVMSYSSSLASAYEAGHEESMDTFSVVSGLWTSFFALGNFLGPTIGGLLFEQIGFPWATVVIQSWAALVIFLICCVRFKYLFFGKGEYHRLPETASKEYQKKYQKGQELKESEQLIMSN